MTKEEEIKQENISKHSFEHENEESLDERILKEEWPSKSHLKDRINSLKYDSDFSVAPPLDPTKWVDNTADKTAIELAKIYQPEILLKGIDLASEKHSANWGGIQFRVLSDKREMSHSNKCVLQYIYIWTKQRVALTFWNLILPIWILIAISLYINTDIRFYQTSPEFVDILGFVPFKMLVTDVINWETRRWLIFFLCSWFVIIGFLNFCYFVNDRVFRPRMGFMIYGLLFGLGHIGELTQEKNPISIIHIGYAINSPHLKQFTINVYQTPLYAFYISIILGLILLVIPIVRKYLQRGPLKTFIHDMDYAPIFIYLIKTGNPQKWKIQKIKYDGIHYCVRTITFIENKDCFEKYLIKKKSNQNNSIAHEPGNPIFVIEGSWHSFVSYSKRRKRMWFVFYGINLVLFGFVCILTLGGILLNTTLLEILNDIQFFPSWLVGFLHKFVYPFFLIIPAYYLLTRLPTKLTSHEKLEEPSSHLTEIKLLNLWNFVKEEAQFLIQKKLQDPEYQDQDSKCVQGPWKSFYNCGKTEKQKNVKLYCKGTWLSRRKNIYRWFMILSRKLGISDPECHNGTQ